MDSALVIALSLLTRTPVAIVAGLAHWKFGHVNWKPFLLLLVSGTISAFIGALLTLAFPMIPSHDLRLLIGYLTVLMGLLILVKPPPKIPKRAGRASFIVKDSHIVTIGILAGFCAGTVGFGWGPIGVSLLILVGMRPQLAIGCSLLSGVAVSLAGGLFHYGVTEISWSLLIPLVAFGTLGAVLGALTSRKIPPERLKPIAALILIILGATTRYAAIF